MTLRVESKTHYSISDVAVVWQELQRHCSDAPVFIRWIWIKNWLQACDTPPTWILCYSNDRVVGTIFFSRTDSSSLTHPFKTGWFNKTGNQKLDQIWIEYNDVFAIPDFHDQAITAILDWCQRQPISEWRLEITHAPSAWKNHPGFHCEIESIPSFQVELDNRFVDIEQYLKTLSSNSRSRIRRAIKYLNKQYGELSVKTYNNPPPKSVMSSISDLHKKRWGKTQEGSGFDNPHFVEFHEQLIATPDEQVTCEILEFYAGKQCLGYTYNLVDHKTVYFYLSGIDYTEEGNRFQPGLVMHALAINHFASLGLKTYDFMGGDSQYKRSLSSHQSHLFAIRLHKKSVVTSIYLGIRFIVSKLRAKES